MWPASWSFSLPSWAGYNSLQKRLVKFLLRRTVGQFLKTELDDENLDVQLSGGQLRLRNVELSEEAKRGGSQQAALNDAIAGLPVVVESGAIGAISVSVPWTQLWTGHCEVRIEELTVKSRLADGAAGDEGVDGSDAASASGDGGRGRVRAGWPGAAGSIAVTEGGASILTTSVFIADDFLRAEMLGRGGKDEVFISKDVERLVANAYEERAQRQQQKQRQQQQQQRPGSGHADGGRPLSPRAGASGSDDGHGGTDALPVPGEPGGAVQGLQVVSEMVDRIVSAVNIRVQRVVVECAVGARDQEAGRVQVSVDSVELLDDRPSGPSAPESRASPADGDQSPETEYRVVKFRTLHKRLEVRGLRVSVLGAEAEAAGHAVILSTFGAPIAAHARIHRRMPFSEVAPVPRAGAAGRRRRSEGDDSAYMGPMPGEFREARPAPAPLSPGVSPGTHYAAQARNNLGEDPAASGWDVSLDIGDIAGVLTSGQLARVMAVVRAAVPLVRGHMERRAVRDQYRERFGEGPAAPEPTPMTQLARWVGLACKHIYVAVVPQDPDALLDGWHDGSLAVLRLKLEQVKHLALYLKGLGAKWESTPAAGTASAPGEAAGSGFMETDFWAAMTREAAARAPGLRSARPIGGGGGGGGGGGSRCTVTVSASLDSFSLYDNCPERHPVVLPLVSIDRTLGRDSRPGKGPAAHDIWLHTPASSPVLTVNVAPIILVLNKALVDRLAVYQALVADAFASGAAGGGNGGGKALQELDAAAHGPSGAAGDHDVTRSIEQLMGNLRLEAEQQLPSNVAVCSPLIRTWITLPGTAGSGDARSTPGRGRGERPAPGHFCIDAVDAVITNVVNGTATSSQSADDVPEGHMRHPHIQELLESRKSVGGSGVRVECESLHVYVQTVEGGDAVEHIGSMHEPSRRPGHASEPASTPRPHVEITTVSPSGADSGEEEEEGAWHWPPAFDAFAAVNDNIRVRMAPESELTTTLEFERQAVASSRVVVSCHLPESDVSLSRTTYQRLNAVINDFQLWQSVQEEQKSSAGSSASSSDGGGGGGGGRYSLGISVLVDMPLMTARILDSDAAAQRAASASQRFRLDNTQLFLSNAIVERGRVYVSVETNQLRLSSFAGERETEAALSHTFATSEAPMITPQLSLFLLTSPTIAEESEIVLKTAWTTFDYTSGSECFRELEAFFSSSGTSGMVQPPPKPMRLSLNVLNSSFRWAPTGAPGLSSAVVSVDSLSVIVGINLSGPERDSEELHYYVEGLSVFGRSADAQPFSSVDVSSDAWISTGRFWKDHGFAALLHMDMVDLASKSREGEDGPLVDLRLYSEALVVDACADSVGTLPLLVQGLLRDIKGSAGPDETRTAPAARRSSGPRVLGQEPGDIFGDVEEDTFAMAPGPAGGYGSAGALAHLAGSRGASGSFTHEFESGRDDIEALFVDEYFAAQEPPDLGEEFEVVGGQALSLSLSPTSPAHPTYSRRAGLPIQQGAQRPPPLSARTSGASAASNRLSLGDDLTEDLALSDSVASSINLNDYAAIGSDSDMLSDAEGACARPEGSRGLRLQSRFAGDAADGRGSVILEPGFPPARAVHLPRARIIDMPGGPSSGPVHITIPGEADSAQFVGDGQDQRGPEDDGAEDFGIIDDYFRAPVPGDASSDEHDDGRAGDATGAMLTLAVDIARVEVRLHAGQDWFLPAEQPGLQSPTGDLGIIPSYMDMLDDGAGAAGSTRGRMAASLPESSVLYGMHSSPLGSPHKQQQQSRQTATLQRSAGPKIRLRATHVHSEIRQFPEASGTAFDLGLNVGALEILDELESSEWSKFLTRRRDGKTGLPATLHSLATARNRQLLTAGTSDSDRVTGVRMSRQRSGRWPEDSAEPMICIHIEAVRPYAALATEELRMDVEVSPLRCYIHQDALDFLAGFFEAAEQRAPAAPAGPGQQPQPQPQQRSADRPYFQIVRVAPINVIFDYKPRRMRAQPGAAAAHAGRGGGGGGGSAELLNFFPLEDAEMTLRMAKIRGVGGLAKLARELGRAWLPHLAQTQIPGVVAGVTPLRSLVNLGSGVADLVILPLEQYRRDGRLVQGIRRGAQSFAKTTALEAIQLGAKVAVNAQTLLEQAGDILNVDVAGGSGGEPGSAAHSHESALSPRDMFGASTWAGEQQQQQYAGDFGGSWPDHVSLDGRSSSGAMGGGAEAAAAAAAAAARRGVFGRSKYARQPENLSDGMRQAYASLRSNVGDAVQTILAIPVVVQEEAGDDAHDGAHDGAAGRSPVHGSVRAVVRAVPVAVLKPMIGATEAVSKTLLGLRNTIEPARRGQLKDKYKPARDPKGQSGGGQYR
ncbi:autophagy- protein 2 [Coemansia javaensis]|uniref:Autophagy-related protein 2 n=1 Tax=Coemansia javaensis TaxID=2761396 RepID=A0A9W8HL14_9FUNG|nr:autophagy- protein 2 [Coemansia javaensis]